MINFADCLGLCAVEWLLVDDVFYYSALEEAEVAPFLYSSDIEVHLVTYVQRSAQCYPAASNVQLSQLQSPEPNAQDRVLDNQNTSVIGYIDFPMPARSSIHEIASRTSPASR